MNKNSVTTKTIAAVQVQVGGPWSTRPLCGREIGSGRVCIADICLKLSQEATSSNSLLESSRKKTPYGSASRFYVSADSIRSQKPP